MDDAENLWRRRKGTWQFPVPSKIRAVKCRWEGADDPSEMIYQMVAGSKPKVKPKECQFSNKFVCVRKTNSQMLRMIQNLRMAITVLAVFLLNINESRVLIYWRERDEWEEKVKDVRNRQKLSGARFLVGSPWSRFLAQMVFLWSRVGFKIKRF